MASPEASALLEALLLGERSGAFDEVQATFTRLGLAHVLAISGMHLVVVAAGCVWLVRLTGDRGGLESLAAALVVCIYLVLVPARAPIVRAGLGVLVFLVADAAGRRYDRITLLGFALRSTRSSSS